MFLGLTVLDYLLILLFISYGFTGFRQGLVVSVLSLAGFFIGGALAMWLLPLAIGHWAELQASPLLRSVVLIAGVFILASAGQALAVTVGRRLRSQLKIKPVQWFDATAGAVAVVLSAAVLVWFIAGALRGGAPAPIAKAIGESRVLRTIDNVVPPGTSRLFASFREVLDREGFPRVFDGLQSERIAPVAPPDPSVVETAGVRQAAASVIKITGVAASCNRGQEGSGWVVAPERVVTNAHVVAGMDTATLRIHGTGRSYTGRVVIFDARRDLAVLSVPGLPAEPLRLGPDLSRGDAGVVAGFPLDGPYRLDAARVREIVDARGSDIYGSPGTSRQVYSLYAQIRPGNSGGPLLSTDGRVVGVVFAKSLDDASTGYALTMDEARPVLAAASGASTPVDTGACVAG
ncbi:S1-C subfamily serine protease [Phycicoccus badiiscoriae]|uniref:S1-C subfamily serine protease n=1 Tax=Pedococcus badiiscoriae TaxID=642776 RepID=A0A852WMI6_9MICO|nr:MarP family serine protease [Pedococcus badiiscoriae]NYG06636.1 S1-C subfamily serine protease [Pedococcus badiiscoriae]